MTPGVLSGAVSRRRASSFRTGIPSSLSVTAIFFLISTGCSLFHTEVPAGESDRNTVRFHHAVKSIRADLRSNDLEGAYRIVKAWEGVPGLAGSDSDLLDRLSRQVRSSLALNLAGQATQLERLGRLHEAQDTIRKAREAEPGWSSLRDTEQHLRIRIAVQSSMDKDWEGVVRRLMVLKSTMPPSGELDRTLSWAWGKLALSQYTGNRLRKAMESATQSLAYDPENRSAKRVRDTISKTMETWTRAGEERFRKNDLSGALEAFRRVLKIDPANAKALKDESLVREAMSATHARENPSSYGGSQPLPSGQH